MQIYAINFTLTKAGLLPRYWIKDMPLLGVYASSPGRQPSISASSTSVTTNLLPNRQRSRTASRTSACNSNRCTWLTLIACKDCYIAQCMWNLRSAACAVTQQWWTVVRHFDRSRHLIIYTFTTYEDHCGLNFGPLFIDGCYMNAQHSWRLLVYCKSLCHICTAC